jgi:putative membrane protein insertion efficiency factor
VTFRSLLTAIILAPIRLYQRFVSPALPRRCKYEPTCSAYAVDAIRELGVVKGSLLAGWRLVRCNPWSHGGWDPVSDRAIFQAAPAPKPAHSHDHGGAA